MVAIMPFVESKLAKWDGGFVGLLRPLPHCQGKPAFYRGDASFLKCEHFHCYARRHHGMICVSPRPFQSIKLKSCIVPFGHLDVHQWIGFMMDPSAPGPWVTR